jgi:diamine N-acetyltransferase
VSKIVLHIPTYDELSYRKKLLSQPRTMGYNKGYNIAFNGYHKDTGCVDFPKSAWKKWYSHWINNKPKTYYAYILDESINEYIGEVNLYYKSDNDWCEIGIVIEDKYRGLGYSKFALKELLKVAFEDYNARAVHNIFEPSREAAVKVHLSSGFKQVKDKDGLISFIVYKDDYFLEEIM